MSTSLRIRFASGVTTNVSVKPVALTMNLEKIIKFDRRAKFSLFVPYHRELASEMISGLMGMSIITFNFYFIV